MKNNFTHNLEYRHGIRQLQSGWADGPAYITQCPIKMGHSYVYNFTITAQRGTLFYHAHISWLRATVHGPIVILPKRGVPYPFAKPYKEVPIVFGNQNVLHFVNVKQVTNDIMRRRWEGRFHHFFCVAGEWFNEDTEAVVSQALQTGGAPNVSEAYTINGLPGPLYNCSAQGN